MVQWYRPQLQADGDSITLYEHKPGSTQHHGDPIADVFAVVARPNSCIIVVADGVNWGIKPRLAARCAVHGSVDHLNSKLFNCPKMPSTTQDVFHDILRSFHSAQKMIIQHGGTTTTLCVAIVVELHDSKAAGSKWGLCVVSVGDSLCYVWRSEEQEVYEVTSEMHLGKERNPRDCGGCLGCDLGDRPDLSNLICCFVPLAEDDIVFVMSDGIVDNVDPVILKDAVSLSQQSTPTTPSAIVPPPILPSTTQQMFEFGSGNGEQSKTDSPSNAQSVAANLPVVNAIERQKLSLAKLTQLLHEKMVTLKRKLNATDVKETLINHVIEVTEEKRKYLEHCWIEMDKPDLTASEKRANDRKIGQYIKQLPGKLDHATVAAYCVGRIVQTESSSSSTSGGKDSTGGNAPTNSYAMNNVAESTTRANVKSVSEGGSVFYSVPVLSRKGRRTGLRRARSEDTRVLTTVGDESESAESGYILRSRDQSNVLLTKSKSVQSPFPFRRQGQEALVSFPVCIDSSSDSF